MFTNVFLKMSGEAYKGRYKTTTRTENIHLWRLINKVE